MYLGFGTICGFRHPLGAHSRVYCVSHQPSLSFVQLLASCPRLQAPLMLLEPLLLEGTIPAKFLLSHKDRILAVHPPPLLDI